MQVRPYTREKWQPLAERTMEAVKVFAEQYFAGHTLDRMEAGMIPDEIDGEVRGLIFRLQSEIVTEQLESIRVPFSASIDVPDGLWNHVRLSSPAWLRRIIGQPKMRTIRFSEEKTVSARVYYPDYEPLKNRGPHHFRLTVERPLNARLPR